MANGNGNGNGDEHRNTLRAMFERHAERMEEIPALIAAVKSLAEELGKLASKVDDQYEKLEKKIDKERESRRTNWPTIFSGIGVLLVACSFAFASWQRGSDAENKSARDLLSLEQQHQKDLEKTRWEWQKELNTTTKEMRVRELERNDKMIADIDDRVRSFEPLLSSMRTKMEASDARFDDLEDKMRGLTAFIDTKLEAARSAAESVRGDVIRLGEKEKN